MGYTWLAVLPSLLYARQEQPPTVPVYVSSCCCEQYCRPTLRLSYHEGMQLLQDAGYDGMRQPFTQKLLMAVLNMTRFGLVELYLTGSTGVC